MKKTIIAGFLAAILVLSLVGCQNTEEKKQATVPLKL